MRQIVTQLSNVDKGSAMPISRNVINYYANTRGRQYVMLPGSLTSRIGRNIFFSLSMCASHLYHLSLTAIQTSFSIRRTFMNRSQSADRYNSLACKSRSYDLPCALGEKRRFQTKKTFMDRAKTFDTFAWPPSSSHVNLYPSNG